MTHDLPDSSSTPVQSPSEWAREALAHCGEDCLITGPFTVQHTLECHTARTDRQDTP